MASIASPAELGSLPLPTTREALAKSAAAGQGTGTGPRIVPAAAPPAAGLLERLDNHVSALRHTFQQIPSLHGTAGALGRSARAVVPGAAIALGSGLAFATTVTPGLLKVSAQATELAEGLRTVPVVGGMLAQVLGCGGHFGLWGGAACIFSATVALLTGEGTWDRRAKWAAAHLAQGFATSPFWVMAAAGTLPGALPGLVLAGACMLGVSLVLAQVLNNERPSWISGVAMATFSVAGGPIGGALAGGVLLPGAAASAGLALAIGALTAAFLIYRSHLAALEDDSTALLRRHEMVADPTRYLDVAGTPPGKASVFVDDQNLRDKLGSLRINLAAGGKLQRERLLLCGPPGTGKTDVAKGLQNHFGWRFFCVPASLFVDDAAPASKITEIMHQAAQVAKTDGRPVGLVFDEAEKLFPDRGSARDAGTVRGDAAWSMTATFNDLFEGACSSLYDQVFAVVITNHPEVTDPAFLSRFSGQRRLELQLPTPEVRRQIFQSRWKTNQLNYKTLAQFTGYVPNEAVTLELEAACAPREHRLASGKVVRLGLSGRDIDEAVNASLNIATVRFGENRTRGTQADFEALLRQQFLLAVRKHFADKGRDLEARAAAPTAQPAAPTGDVAAQIATALDGSAGDRLADRIALALRGTPAADQGSGGWAASQSASTSGNAGESESANEGESGSGTLNHLRHLFGVSS